MGVVYKNKATPIKKIGKYTCWYYEEEFVITKQSYMNRESIKEKIVGKLEDSDVIGIMNQNYLTFRGIKKIRKIGVNENEFENI